MEDIQGCIWIGASGSHISTIESVGSAHTTQIPEVLMGRLLYFKEVTSLGDGVMYVPSLTAKTLKSHDDRKLINSLYAKDNKVWFGGEELLFGYTVDGKGYFLYISGKLPLPKVPYKALFFIG